MLFDSEVRKKKIKSIEKLLFQILQAQIISRKKYRLQGKHGGALVSMRL